jgi:hypothetical protein
MKITEIHFYPTTMNRTLPYIRDEEATVFICDGSEGSVLFNGYYYVQDSDIPSETGHLPKQMEIHVKIREKEPYKEEYLEDGSTRLYHVVYDEYFYIIEVYKRVKHESTNEISEIEDDGEPMEVCFFPTDLQTLYFRVLKNLY